MHQLKSTETSCTNRHSLTSSDPPRCCLRMAESVCWRQLMSVGMCWLLLLSGYVLIMSGGAVGVYGCIWVMFMDIWGVCMCLEGYLGAHPLNGGKFILFWHSPEKPNCFHQAKLRHQNVHIYPEKKWLGLSFSSSLVFVREKLKDTFTWITLNCCWGQNLQKKASWPGFLASGKDSRTKVVLARKL